MLSTCIVSGESAEQIAAKQAFLTYLMEDLKKAEKSKPPFSLDMTMLKYLDE